MMRFIRKLFRLDSIHTTDVSDGSTTETFAPIDLDAIYRREWIDRRNQIDVQLISDALMKISDIDWVLDECVHSTTLCFDSMRALLEHGLLLARNDHQLKQRLILLHYLDVLDDFMVIYETPTMIDYMESRKKSILELAQDTLERCRFTAFDRLYKRHQSILAPYYLALLSRIPEVVTPSLYESLLPNATNDRLVVLEIIYRRYSRIRLFDGSINQQRYLHDNQIQMILADVDPDRQEQRNEIMALIDRFTSHHCDQQLQSTIPYASFDDLLNWYEQRARTIEEKSALPPVYVDFLRIAINKGFKQFQTLLIEAEMFAKYVYQSGDVSRSFTQFNNLTPTELVTVLVRETLGSGVNYANLHVFQVPTDRLANAIHQRILPFLLYLQQRNGCTVKGELWQLLVNASRSSLLPIRQFLTSLDASLAAHLQLTVYDRIQLIDDCLSKCDLIGDEFVRAAAQLLAVAPSDDGDPTTMHLLNTMNRVLNGLETMAIYECRPTYATVKSAINDRQQAMHLMTLIVRRIKPVDWTLIDWKQLYTHCLQLVDQLFITQLSVVDCQRLFVSALLNSADTTIIAYAQEFMIVNDRQITSLVDDDCRQLPYADSIELILAAAREYVNGALNSNDALIELARATLSLIDDACKSDEIAIERDLLTALRLLEELSVVELPVNIRLVSDKSELLKRAVQARSDNYRQLVKCAELARLLHIARPNATALLMCTVEAIQRRDTRLCAKYVEQILDQRLANRGWPMCIEAVRSGAIAPIALRQRCIAFALMHCAPDEIDDILVDLHINVVRDEICNRNGVADRLTLYRSMVGQLAMIDRWRLDNFYTKIVDYVHEDDDDRQLVTILCDAIELVDWHSECTIVDDVHQLVNRYIKSTTCCGQLSTNVHRRPVSTTIDEDNSVTTTSDDDDVCNQSPTPNATPSPTLPIDVGNQSMRLTDAGGLRRRR